jgi:DNA modification methylase
MRSPKLLSGTAADRYYRYYAGFTTGFVEDMFDWLGVGEESSIVDPWNGSGTTTAAAATRGAKAIGFDISPVAVLIGRSRLLTADVAGSLSPLGGEIWQHAQAHPHDVPIDPLAIWFGPNTTREIRSLERAIHDVLVGGQTDPVIYDPQLPQSALAAAFYVILFQTVRRLVRRYVPSNPAWIKYPSGSRIGVPREYLRLAFQRSIERLTEQVAICPRSASGPREAARIAMCSSSSLPLPDSSIDAIITSPPYCTRLDYVKATLPELAVLGLGQAELRGLRDRMIGTPTITGDGVDARRKDMGEATDRLLQRIGGHSSKASSTYYLKYYTQYFSAMHASMSELLRVIKPGKSAVLVLQDSYYKDVHVDLPALMGDMSMAVGWASWTRIDFQVRSTMATIHPGTRSYQRPMTAVESAVALRS